MKSHYLKLNKGEPMQHRGPKTPLMAVCAVFMMLMGCAGGMRGVKSPSADIRQWEKLAKASRGYSPSPSERYINNVPGAAGAVNGEGPVNPGAPLPVQKISLRMRDADVKSILRAIALSSGVNLLVPDDVKGTTSIDFSEVPWDQAFLSIIKSYGLTYVWQGDVLRVLTLADLKRDLDTEAVKNKLESEGPLSTVVVPVNYADASKLQKELEKLLDDKGAKHARGSVLVDSYSNSLIIHATPDETKKMLAVIEDVDKPASQVLIRANIVETTKEEARNLGIQWGGVKEFVNGGKNLWITPGGQTGTTTSGATSTAGGGGTPLPVPYSPTSGAAGIGQQGFGVNFPVPQTTVLNNGIGSLGLLYGNLSGNILDMQLQALQTEGKINIISSPSITTLDNQKAFTESGTRVPYVTYTFSGSSTTPTVNFVDAVLRLEITPHIIDGKNLKLSIVVNKDDVDTSREVQGNPYILQKKTSTTLIDGNGETIVISGLTNQNYSRSVSGLPFLKDIPILGWLFKGESRDNTMNQVLIFITPYILPREAAAGMPAAVLKSGK